MYLSALRYLHEPSVTFKRVRQGYLAKAGATVAGGWWSVVVVVIWCAGVSAMICTLCDPRLHDRLRTSCNPLILDLSTPATSHLTGIPPGACRAPAAPLDRRRPAAAVDRRRAAHMERKANPTSFDYKVLLVTLGKYDTCSPMPCSALYALPYVRYLVRSGRSWARRRWRTGSSGATLASTTLPPWEVPLRMPSNVR
jgi:hypothetical protein